MSRLSRGFVLVLIDVASVEMYGLIDAYSRSVYFFGG